jgi:hypothetical protein
MDDPVTEQTIIDPQSINIGIEIAGCGTKQADTELFMTIKEVFPLMSDEQINTIL